MAGCSPLLLLQIGAQLQEPLLASQDKWPSHGRWLSITVRLHSWANHLMGTRLNPSKNKHSLTYLEELKVENELLLINQFFMGFLLVPQRQVEAWLNPSHLLNLFSLLLFLTSCAGDRWPSLAYWNSWRQDVWSTATWSLNFGPSPLVTNIWSDQKYKYVVSRGLQCISRDFGLHFLQMFNLSASLAGPITL